jgi:hypothetical protein
MYTMRKYLKKIQKKFVKRKISVECLPIRLFQDLETTITSRKKKLKNH